MRWGLAAALLVPVLAAQESGAAPEKPREEARQERGDHGAGRSRIEELIEELGAPGWAERERAERELRSLGRPALERLRETAREHADPEVRHRAGRLVRRLERGGRLRPRGLAPRGEQGGRGPLGGVLEELERRLGLDGLIPRFFHEGMFDDLERRVEEMRARLRDMHAARTSERRSFEMRVGPDGVRLRIQEQDASGEPVTKTYEAPDLDSFRRKYPEIAERYLDPSGGPGIRLRFGTVPEPQARRIEGPRLGVYVRAVPPQVRAFLGLEEGRGLWVEDVVEGTLAERLGIEPGDILLEVAGRPVGSPRQVREALAGRAPSGEVAVRVNRRGAERVLEAAAEPPSPPARKGGLRRRAKAR